MHTRMHAKSGFLPTYQFNIPSIQSSRSLFPPLSHPSICHQQAIISQHQFTRVTREAIHLSASHPHLAINLFICSRHLSVIVFILLLKSYIHPPLPPTHPRIHPGTQSPVLVSFLPSQPLSPQPTGNAEKKPGHVQLIQFILYRTSPSIAICLAK